MLNDDVQQGGVRNLHTASDVQQTLSERTLGRDGSRVREKKLLEDLLMTLGQLSVERKRGFLQEMKNGEHSLAVGNGSRVGANDQ